MQTCMQTKNRIVDAILKFEDWHIEKSKLKPSKVMCNDKHGVPISFIDSIHVYRHLNSIEQLRKLLFDATCVCNDIAIASNQWQGLNDEEVLIKCELENNL